MVDEVKTKVEVDGSRLNQMVEYHKFKRALREIDQEVKKGCKVCDFTGDLIPGILTSEHRHHEDFTVSDHRPCYYCPECGDANLAMCHDTWSAAVFDRNLEDLKKAMDIQEGDTDDEG